VSAIGTAHVEAGRPARAIAPIRRSLDLYRAAVGPDHPHYATSLHNLGVAEARSGAHADAESHLREALATRRRVLDAKSFYIAHTVGAIGELQGLRGEYAAAERSYGEALALMAASGNVSAKERTALERGLAEVRRRVARAGR
jgi:tetratricopeptide (TPR) repeat protein